jgi:putative DNA primase/helicase
MRRLFLPMKNNIGNDRTGLAFELQSAQVDSPARVIETCRVMWHAELVTITADEVTRPDDNESGHTATDDAAEWLREVLTDGPISASDIKRMARDAGHTSRIVQRARADIGVRTRGRRYGPGAQWVWCIDAIDAKPITLAPMDKFSIYGREK